VVRESAVRECGKRKCSKGQCGKKMMQTKDKNKKAYLKTLEAFIAFFITFIFVVFIVAEGDLPEQSKKELGALAALEQRDDFRDCVYANNATCIERLAAEFIPGVYDYKVAINSPDPFKGAKNIYTETLFVASNETNSYKTIYLYYWLLSG
jgi:hypothetical protein